MDGETETLHNLKEKVVYLLSGAEVDGIDMETEGESATLPYPVGLGEILVDEVGEGVGETLILSDTVGSGAGLSVGDEVTGSVMHEVADFSR